MTLTIKTDQIGLSMFLRPYQQIALQCIWDAEGGKSSREVWEYVNDNLPNGSISRASVINFLNYMVDEGLLDFETTTGKGGHRRIYHQKYNLSEFKLTLINISLIALKKSFPEETTKIIQGFL
jgi:hypothetical protein